MQVQSSNKPKQLKTQLLNDAEEEDSKEQFSQKRPNTTSQQAGRQEQENQKTQGKQPQRA